MTGWTRHLAERVVVDAALLHAELHAELRRLVGTGETFDDEYLSGVLDAAYAAHTDRPGLSGRQVYTAVHAALLASGAHSCERDWHRLMNALAGTAGLTHRGIEAAVWLAQADDRNRIRHRLAAAAQSLDLGADPAVVAARLARTAA